MQGGSGEGEGFGVHRPLSVWFRDLVPDYDENTSITDDSISLVNV